MSEVTKLLQQERKVVVAELAKIDKALTALGTEVAAPAGTKAPRKRRATKKQIDAITKAQEARRDSVAVKKGTATPEQIARHNARLAKKLGVLPRGVNLGTAAE